MCLFVHVAGAGVVTEKVKTWWSVFIGFVGLVPMIWKLERAVRHVNKVQPLWQELSMGKILLPGVASLLNGWDSFQRVWRCFQNCQISRTDTSNPRSSVPGVWCH